MPPEGPGARMPERRLAVLLAAVALAAAVAGAWWFVRFESQLVRDPALVYRDAATLEKQLKRAGEAERGGDRAAAITIYRFVATVGAAGGPELAPYLAAARAGLRRLAAGDTLPDRPR